jgi:exonuclease SbcC
VRLHRLSVTAFGPFKDPIEVDFDSLGEAGLFLLSGPTGAGKSSILDAVCFALYGDVPGDRAVAKRLRCDHAEPDMRPVVELEATLGGRRFLVERSPAWERPKRRGSGTTTEQARVVIQEWMDGGWFTRSSRLDETGHLVTSLVGMNLPQFCQVALLPQGRFQAFLRARSEERHALLQQVFRTGRFDQVERWLQDHRAQVRRDVDTTLRQASDLVSRACEVVGGSAPEGWQDLPETLRGWVAHHEAALARQLAEARSAQDLATTARDVAADELARATAHRDAQAAHDAACQRVDRLRSQAEDVGERRERLTRARRAEPVQVLEEVAIEAADALRAAEDGAARARTRVVDLVGPDVVTTDADAVDAVVRDALHQQQLLDGLRPLQREREEIVRQCATLGRRRKELARAATRHREQAEVALARAEERLVDARASVAAHDLEVVAAKEHWLEVREARLAGIAAEIAGGLVVGGCCPVCGSSEHPFPAAAAPGAPGVEDERAARRAVDDLEATTLAARDALTRAEVDVAAARDAARAEPHAVEIAEIDARAQALEDQCAALDARLADALATQPTADVDTARQHWADVESAATGLLRSLEVVASARRAHERSRAAADRSAVSLGFDDASSALAVVLAPADLDALEASVRQYDEAVARAEEALTLAPAPEMPPEGVPDLAAARAAAQSATAEVDALSRRIHDLETRAGRLAALRESLGEMLTRLAPQRSALEVAISMAGLVSGKSVDNRLQMRLSAYVLASRLSQVVAAANVRLATMSDHRFSLEHTGRRGAGETRGGLSLLVRDDWSGETRDPATLSGGETFVVSLALALGLADVITQEAGGAQVDTLFVDEGFGSLDPETLDDVMTTLDSLRDGGRCVGVVSHVPEMQVRIPAQLRVHKSRRGSHVTQHLG